MTLRRLSRREHLTLVKGQLEGLAIMASKQPEPYGPRIPEKRAPRQPSGIRPERLVLRDILKYLRMHPMVACVWRMQSGLLEAGDRPIRVGVVGMPDIVGMLKGGRMFAIEVKSEVGRTTESQEYWLDTIRHFGGLAGVARCTDDVDRIIGS